MKADVLKNRWALVAGASSGLGADFARILASTGCHLILVARRQGRLEALKKEINADFDVSVKVIPMDLSLPESSQKLYDQIKEVGIVVDVLINNAGFDIYGEFLDIDWEHTHQMLQLNMITVAHLTWLFAQDMASRNFGYILHIASNGAYQPSPLYAAYSASKSFVLSFSEALNYELRGTNVKCTALSPGITVTEFHKVSGQKEGSLYYRLTKMDSMTVARMGIEALLAGRPSLVPNWMVSVMAWSSQRIPRRLATAMAAWLMRLQS
jgi:short-subunit dehydrogenase